ncbi:MAG: lipid IV(A) 3-deoxy-D-manno-octulosonic acid transferase [Thiobacillaceae bacterium]|nr:lipid IV(A) 3-deoxy-D-manno-octulosonic acid transferase [Thiobacillaceae bacterium]
MRLLYTLAWWALLPFAFLYLLWRSRRQPEYRRHWGERLGGAPDLAARQVIWVHAVSVGETRAAAPLIRALRERHPDHVLLLSHATPTGRATGAELFGQGVVQAYLPYDLPPFVARFLARARPVLGIVLETEVWPNLMAACARRGVPVYLVNARLSERSARGYARFAALTRAALDRFRGIAAQTRGDAERLVGTGARGARVTGNLKFDVTPPADTAARAAELSGRLGNRFVFLAASTREGEEALLLDAWRAAAPPDTLLVIVPRHPQRFDAVAALIQERGLALARRSEARDAPADAAVFLGDSMGELAAYYAACDVAYVGGSLLPLGGQNLIEAAAAGRPVLIGPHTWNFAEAAAEAVARGAALRVGDATELLQRLGELRQDAALRRRMGEAGEAFARAHRGATERVLAMLEEALPTERQERSRARG